MKLLKYKKRTEKGCYKIDLFIDGAYLNSTGCSKTCKQAIAKYKNQQAACTYKDKRFTTDCKLTAHFDLTF